MKDAVRHCQPASPHADAHDRWSAIMRAALPRMRSYVRRVAATGHDAEELLAEVHVQAWINRAAVIDDEAPFRIVMQHVQLVCRTWVRHRRREVPLDAVFHGGVEDDSAETGTGMSIDEAQRRLDWGKRALAQLSENQRAVVDLRYRWSLSYAMIAAALGMSEATARVHAFRGIGRLRSIVATDPPPWLLGEDSEL